MTDEAVVGMVDEHVGGQRLGIHHDQPVRTVAAELAGQVLQQRRPIDDLAVHVPEEGDVGDAADLGGAPRLAFAELPEGGGVLAGILHALLA